MKLTGAGEWSWGCSGVGLGTIAISTIFFSEIMDLDSLSSLSTGIITFGFTLVSTRMDGLSSRSAFTRSEACSGAGTITDPTSLAAGCSSQVSRTLIFHPRYRWVKH